MDRIEIKPGLIFPAWSHPHQVEAPLPGWPLCHWEPWRCDAGDDTVLIAHTLMTM